MGIVPAVHRPYDVSPQTHAINQQFYRLDYRLRGYDLYEYPIHPEPRYLARYYADQETELVKDDGRHETFLSSLYKSLTSGWEAPPAEPEPVVEEEPAPDLYIETVQRIEFQITLDKDGQYQPKLVASFLQGLKGLQHPLSFELIAAHYSIIIQFSCSEADHTLVASQLQVFFPAVLITESRETLAYAVNGMWRDMAMADFGLADECGMSIAQHTQSTVLDPFTSLIAVLESVNGDECVVFQVLFSPANHYWSDVLVAAVTDYDGGCIFADAPYLLKETEAKASEPMFATLVRVACVALSQTAANTLLKNVAGALGQFDNPTRNRLMPLVNDNYPTAVHLDDIVSRTTHRTGMLLSLSELVGLVHLPSASLNASKLPIQTERTKAAPSSALNHPFTLGTNTHASQVQTVGLTPAQRMRHTYVIGASGTGKTTLLRNLLLQDITAGEGVALLDPHGDLVDSIVAQMPASRLDDVVLFDASDEAYPIGFNILHAHSEAEKTLLASDLTMTFRRLSESWGDRMHTILANGIMAMLDHSEGGTLMTLRRFLTDKVFRQQYLRQISDTEIRYFWERQYPLYTGRPEASVLTRLDTFLRQKTIRNMVAQPKSSINFSAVMDGRKILLVKLAHGAIGEENAHLLGSLIVTAIYQAALRRQAQAEASRIPFYLYIDEFQNLVTPSMEAILSGARKYNLGMTLAHQERRQLLSKDRDVASSVIANAYTHLCFRLGHEDAAALAKGLSFFDAYDLQNLGLGQAIARVEQLKYDFNLSVPFYAKDQDQVDHTEAIIQASRARYASPKAMVEQQLQALYRYAPAKPSSAPTTPKTKPVVEPKPDTIPPEPEPVQEVPPVQESTEPAKPKEKLLGRGGTNHSYLQNLIKKYAEEKGFKAIIEEKVLGGSGFVDVSLTFNKLKIACEISISTEIAYEVQNIQKCLAAGYDQVVVVSNKQSKLDRLLKQAREVLDDVEMQQAYGFLPEGFVLHLDSLVANQQKPEKTVRGYKVKSSFKATSKAEGDAKSLAVARLIGKGMR